jgi:hypothetical protein
LKDGCSVSRDSDFPDYEKLHFGLFGDLFFAGNVKDTVGLAAVLEFSAR